MSYMDDCPVTTGRPRGHRIGYSEERIAFTGSAWSVPQWKLRELRRVSGGHLEPTTREPQERDIERRSAETLETLQSSDVPLKHRALHIPIRERICECGTHEWSKSNNWQRCRKCQKQRDRETRARWYQENGRPSLSTRAPSYRPSPEPRCS